MSTVNPVTLDEVNNNLLERLNVLIGNASADQLLAITEAVAKLNASRRNSDQFLKPESEEVKSEKERAAVLGEIING